MQRRVAVVIDGSNRVAQFHHQLDRLQGFPGAPRTLARRPDTDARRHEQRCGAVLVRQHRVGPQLEQQLHQFDVDRLRGQQERRRAGPVEHVPVAVPRLRRLPRVDVGAVGHERADQFEIGHWSGRDCRRVVVVPVRTAGPDQLVEGRPARPGGGGVGAALEEAHGEPVVRVHDREMERAGPVRQRQVDVRASVEQGAHGLAVAGPDREGQRREAGIGWRIDAGAGGDERRDDGGVPFRRRPHQGGLPAPAFARLDRRAGAVPNERLDARRDTRPRRQHEQRFAPSRDLVRIGAGHQERVDDGRMAGPAGERDRGDAVAVRGIDRRAVAQLPRDGGEVAGMRRLVQRRRTVAGALRRRCEGRRQQQREHHGNAGWTLG